MLLRPAKQPTTIVDRQSPRCIKVDQDSGVSVVVCCFPHVSVKGEVYQLSYYSEYYRTLVINDRSALNRTSAASPETVNELANCSSVLVHSIEGNRRSAGGMHCGCWYN